MSLQDLSQIAKIAAAMRRHDEGFRSVAKEIRLHPDDYSELVRDSLCLIAQPWDRPETLFGLPVVVDEAAARLPRKPKP